LHTSQLSAVLTFHVIATAKRALRQKKRTAKTRKLTERVQTKRCWNNDRLEKIRVSV